jgi:hypothetical protein
MNYLETAEKRLSGAKNSVLNALEDIDYAISDVEHLIDAARGYAPDEEGELLRLLGKFDVLKHVSRDVLSHIEVLR